MTNIEVSERLVLRVPVGTKFKLRGYGKRNKISDISKVVRQAIENMFKSEIKDSDEATGQHYDV